MISDNYVTGDNIYLRELQSFFFEVLGMMSITHYGAVGDGRVDNYGPLQVAIDDANRRGLSFLYVPYGRFIYTGELANLIDETTGKPRIIFMGNPNSHIVNIRTGEEIRIYQFGWLSEYYYSKDEADDRFVNIDGDQMTGSLGIGDHTETGGTFSFAQGDYSRAMGDYSHAENGSVALGDRSHSEGGGIAEGVTSHAENIGHATGNASHAEGAHTTASEWASHAEGDETTASGDNAHAEGYKTEATGNSSHAEGDLSIASGLWSHAEGHVSQAKGNASHAGGQNTQATRYAQTAIGVGNVVESGDIDTHDGTSSALVVGNGVWDEDTQTLTTSNAFKVQFDGTGWFSGDVYVGSTSGTDKDSGSKKLISEADLQAFATLNNLQMPS